MDAMADEWVCPITTELPLDPVTAEDGHAYERSAIEELIRVQGARLKSPITNLPMGSCLFPNTQARNTIEKLCRSGAIGDKAERWLLRLSDEELVKATVQEAEGGDVSAMCSLCLWHHKGTHGLSVDAEAAFRWAKKGADLRDVACMSFAGSQMLGGYGCKEQVGRGIAMLVEAAMGGSRCAAFFLGDVYYDGDHEDFGFPKCKEEAKVWYSRVAGSSIHDLDQELVIEAAMRADESDDE